MTVFTLVAFMMVGTPTLATASVAKGQKIFKKN